MSIGIRHIASALVCAGLLLGAVAGCVSGPSGDAAPAVPAAGPRELTLESVAKGLDTPWAMAFAPDGRLFVTERAGRVRVIDKNGLRPEPWATVDVIPASYESEGGLLGIAVAPDFATSGHVFVVATTAGSGRLSNRLLRFTDRDGKGVEQLVVFDQLPVVHAAPGAEQAIHTHVGGGIVFGPDGMLYLSMGDATQPELSQDARSLAGKIIRLSPDGSVPTDSVTPGSPIYALGFRNPLALAWSADTGELFVVDNGPSELSWERKYGGGWFADELNAVRRGGNYGWPRAIGAGKTEGSSQFIAPLVDWSPSVAPTGVAVYLGPHAPWQGSIFVTTLRGQRLWRVAFDRPNGGGPPKVATLEPLLEGKIGRIRAIAMGPDGLLYIGSSNRDRRGRPGPDDDQIYRVKP